MMRYFWIGLGLLLLSQWADAQAFPFPVSADSSYILLHWQMIGKSAYHARLTGLQGTMVINPERDTDNQLQVRMPIVHLDAHHQLLTWVLKSHQFFDAERYPFATFRSTRILDRGDGRYQVFGTLQIKDQRRPVILYGKRSAYSRLTAGGYVRLSGTLALSRQAFGMGRYPSLVADPIAVEIVLVSGKAPD